MALASRTGEAVVEQLRAIVAARADRFGIRLAYLFGSHARGQARPESDVDVATHLVAALAWRKPEHRTDLFHVLAEQGVLPGDLARRLGQAMVMRNAIVHGYLRIALDLVHSAIQHDLGDLETFSQRVLRLMDATGRRGGD